MDGGVLVPIAVKAARQGIVAKVGRETICRLLTRHDVLVFASGPQGLILRAAAFASRFGFPGINSLLRVRGDHGILVGRDQVRSLQRFHGSDVS